MSRLVASSVTIAAAICLLLRGPGEPDRPAFESGFGEADVTPELGRRPVYLAGFGHNRKATGVHDPLKARAIALRAGDKMVALISVDVVGLFHDLVERVRARLPAFSYVLVSSTHNHEGPDTLGLWGPSAFSSGVDPAYMTRLEDQIVAAARSALGNLRPARALIGTASAPGLLHDSREPYVKHDELVALRFTTPAGDRNLGAAVQWNCHPETLSSGNTQVSADFVGYTVAHLQESLGCPVVYLTGTVGGLMTSLGVPVPDDSGRPLADGTYEKTARYGRLVGELATRSLSHARPLDLMPIRIDRRDVYLPLDNPLYKLGRQLGIFQRKAYLWTGDPNHAEPADPANAGKSLAVRTEVARLRLGELDIAAIPGEIYPELVLGKVQDPPDPGADFPGAPVEPAIYQQLTGHYRMIVGLANDELGYIIPKRQWDEKPPFCYGRKKAQYGEVNSLGPDTAPFLCAAFRALTLPR